MFIDEFRDYCLAKSQVTEEMPFDDKVLVFKVAGKMFAACDVEEFESVNLKCDPQLALEYREKYQSVLPGYHMNKKHWNTVESKGDVPDDLLFKMIDDSYNLVVKGFSKKQQKELGFLP